MNSGFYAAYAGLLAKMDAFQLAANNLANVNTTGYKGQREFYRSLTAALGNRPLSPLNRAINNFGVLGGATVDLSNGVLERTGNDLHLAMENSGFFAVQTASGVRYTRNGSFRVGPTGQLVSSSGDTVLDDQGRPIAIPAGVVSVGTDGAISVAGALVGRLRLVEFPPPTPLTPEGASYFRAPVGTELPAADPVVRQGMLEASNVNGMSAAVGLIALQRHAEMLQRVLTIFHTDFNRAAAQDLPRI